MGSKAPLESRIIIIKRRHVISGFYSLDIRSSMCTNYLSATDFEALKKFASYCRVKQMHIGDIVESAPTRPEVSQF